MKFTIHQSSRHGSRPYNQDRLAYSYTKDALLLVVADGMGGHRHGEVAAQLAVKSITDAFQQMATPVLENPAKFLSAQIQQIHEAIESMTLADDLLESPRTTIVTAVLQRGELHCAHVGDSRLYHFRDGRLLYRTEDHSVVQMLHRRGHISKRAMLSHPDRHKLYNCLGGEKLPQIDLAKTQNLRDGDTLLLCTDGLWANLSDEKIGETLHGGYVNNTIPSLLNLAESLNGENSDNISGMGVQWGDLPSDIESERQKNKLAVSTVTMPLGATTTIINPPTHQQTTRNDNDDESARTAKDLTDEEIEKTIAEIQAAINKTQI
ncbi:MAG TPA: protein phosphatase 2C domain-containing protein [Methylophilaceae bacterium]|nr:protein phosphatase 2C domain-containing protein [Methylophilaceae bacterium]